MKLKTLWESRCHLSGKLTSILTSIAVLLKTKAEYTAYHVWMYRVSCKDTRKVDYWNILEIRCLEIVLGHGIREYENLNICHSTLNKTTLNKKYIKMGSLNYYNCVFRECSYSWIRISRGVLIYYLVYFKPNIMSIQYLHDRIYRIPK